MAFLTWADVPVVYPVAGGATKKFCKLLWQSLGRAQGSTIRGGRWGDSTGTFLGGAGVYYGPLLQQHINALQGGQPETMWFPPFANADGFCIRGGTTLSAASSVPTANQAPGHIPLKFTSTGIDSEGFGVKLQRDAISCSKWMFANNQGPTYYFDITEDVYIRVLAATESGSGTGTWRNRSNSTEAVNYGGSILASGTCTTLTAANLNNAALAVFGENVGPILLSGAPYPNMIFKSDGASPVNYLDAKFYTPDLPGGHVITPFAVGGIQTNWFEANRADCDLHVQAMEMHYAWVAVGLNDAYGASVTAEDYYDRLVSLIAWLRVKHNNPNLIVVLESQHYRAGGTAGQDTEYDQYAGVMKQICDEDSNCLTINMRRVLQNFGFGEGGLEMTGLTNKGDWSPTYTTDTGLNYLVGDATIVGRVNATANSQNHNYYRCIFPHASSNSIAPGTALGTLYWQPIANAYAAPFTDTVHEGVHGARIRASLTAGILDRLANMGNPSLRGGTIIMPN